MNTYLDKIGGLGSVIAATAAAAPCCLPFLAAVGSAVGLGAFSTYSEYLPYAVQGFAFLAVVGAFLSFRKHQNSLPLMLVIVSFGALIYVYNVFLVASLLYFALILLVIAAIWNTVATRKCNQCPPNEREQSLEQP